MTGREATVSVPATSANLGPGFDAIGLALDVRDVVRARLTDEPGVRVEIHGNGADDLPRDENHLVAQVLIATADSLGHVVTGLDVECTNVIPQGRGMGSSASAIVAGLVLARALFDSPLSDAELLIRATVMEGHADNVSACLLGGLTVAAWDTLAQVRAVSLVIHPDITAVMAVPDAQLATTRARGMLPTQVSFHDAVFNASRAATLVAAMTQDPALLLEATADRLHQDYRRDAYPESMALVTRLRTAGLAAAISGAGPSVLVLTTKDRAAQAAQAVAGSGFAAREVGLTRFGAHTL